MALALTEPSVYPLFPRTAFRIHHATQLELPACRCPVRLLDDLRNSFDKNIVKIDPFMLRIVAIVRTLTAREPKKGRHSSRMPVALMSAENHERGKQEFTDGEVSTIPANSLSRLLEPMVLEPVTFHA